MLHIDVLTPCALDLLSRIQRSEIFAGVRLVGGTALVLQIGHRTSIDLDFFGQEALDRFELSDMVAFYQRKFPDGSIFPVLKSLVFFDDAEEDPMPNMLKPCDWETVKRRIFETVARYSP